MTLSVAVTTAKNPSPDMQAQAAMLAAELHAPLVERGEESRARLAASCNAARLLVVEDGKLRLWDSTTGTDYAFHPNLLTVRAGALMRGERDLFAEATDFQPGDSHLDCTLGFGTEAALAALLVSQSGRVTGLESVPELAAVTRAGLQNFPLANAKLRDALRRIHVVTADYRAFLAACPPASYDVVYFDPFFPHRLSGSETSAGVLAVFGNLTPLDGHSVTLACRAARKRVVVKTPRDVPLPFDLPDTARWVTSRHSRLAFCVLSPRP